jgi:hypothetical protein
MVHLIFKDLTFEEKGAIIRVNFLKIFYFDINKEELEKIGKFKTNKNSILFSNISEEKVKHKFNFILKKGFDNLRNKLNGNKTIYLHKNSGIPLIGCLAFGIVDKGSNMIEVKPITNCNLNCIFCSVDEGKSSKKRVDFVVERNYLVAELKKLIDYKLSFDRDIKFEIYINPHGEPLLYADIIDLIKDISKISNINVISIITNGTLLNKILVDKLIKAGLNQINLSLNAINVAEATKLAGNKSYNIKKLLTISEYLINKLKVVISPIFLSDINDKEIEKIIKFSKKIKAEVLIQKFLYNKKGRNPIKEQPWQNFYEKLKKLEKKYNVKLIKSRNILKTKELPVPFKKGDIIKAKIVCNGGYLNESIAVANKRVIVIKNCFKTGIVKIKITNNKHNIFYGISY